MSKTITGLSRWPYFLAFICFFTACSVEPVRNHADTAQDNQTTSAATSGIQPRTSQAPVTVSRHYKIEDNTENLSLEEIIKNDRVHSSQQPEATTKRLTKRKKQRTVPEPKTQTARDSNPREITESKPQSPIDSDKNEAGSFGTGGSLGTGTPVTGERLKSPATTHTQSEIAAKSPPKLAFKTNSKISHKQEVYDPTGPAYSVLQAPRQALKDFPVDSNGKVDWVKTLESGVIDPQAALSRKGSMRIRDLDIIMKNTLEMPWVRFPHRQHSEWLACSNCHPAPFIEQEGGNPITMDAIFRGRYCGQCHDRVAFSIFVCERCHSVPHKDAPEPWWQ